MEAVPTIPAPPATTPENAEAAAEVSQRLWPPCSTGDPVAAGLANLAIPDVAEAPATLVHQPSLSTVVVPATPNAAEKSTSRWPQWQHQQPKGHERSKAPAAPETQAMMTRQRRKAPIHSL